MLVRGIVVRRLRTVVRRRDGWAGNRDKVQNPDRV